MKTKTLGIQLDSMYLFKTYAGCLMGVPDPASWRDMLVHKTKNVFGSGRQTIVVGDIITNGHLPRWCIYWWLNGPARTELDDGTELVVVQFCEEILPEAFQNVLGMIDWEKDARGYQI